MAVRRPSRRGAVNRSLLLVLVAGHVLVLGGLIYWLGYARGGLSFSREEPRAPAQEVLPTTPSVADRKEVTSRSVEPVEETRALFAPVPPPEGVPPWPPLEVPDVYALFEEAYARESGPLLDAAAHQLLAYETPPVPIRFADIETRGRAVVVCFDDGGSSLRKAREAGIGEAVWAAAGERMLASLPPQASFGFVRFVRRLGTFRDTLAAPTEEARTAGAAWLRASLGKQKRATGYCPDRDGVEGALAIAFGMGADTVFVVSDLDFQRSPGGDVPWPELAATVARLQEGRSTPARLFFVGVSASEEDLREARALAGRWGGEARAWPSP